MDQDSQGDVTQRVEFTYDMFGRRLSKTVDGEATYFVYDKDNVILDFVENGSNVVLDERYLHGTRTDQVVAQEDGAGNVTWHLSDHLGSVRDLIDNDGNVVNHFVYDSFGNVVSESGTVISRFLFTGREWDDEVALYHYRARPYSSTLGRFISEDPIGFSSGDSNLYRYVENNSINAINPFGTASEQLTLLLKIAQPREGSDPDDATIYRYPKSPNYSIAFGTASYWYSQITEVNSYSPKTPSNRKPGVNIPWLVYAPLKGGAGSGNLRPAGSSGPDPTIDLFPDKRGSHNTPGHKSAKEIKFEWERSDKQCVILPEIPAVFTNPQPKPKAPEDYPDPEPWWEKLPDIDIPTIPIPGWDPSEIPV